MTSHVPHDVTGASAIGLHLQAPLYPHPGSKLSTRKSQNTRNDTPPRKKILFYAKILHLIDVVALFVQVQQQRREGPGLTSALIAQVLRGAMGEGALSESVSVVIPVVVILSDQLGLINDTTSASFRFKLSPDTYFRCDVSIPQCRTPTHQHVDLSL